MNKPRHLRAVDSVLRHSKPSGTGSLAGGSEPPHDGGMEARVAKLEAALEHVQKDVGEIKADIRDTKNAWIAFKDDVNSEFKAVRSEMRSDTWKLLGIFGAGFALLLAAMAKGFGWF